MTPPPPSSDWSPLESALNAESNDIPESPESALGPELVELLDSLMGLARERFGPHQGLLAAIFVADALKAGGFEPDRLRLGTTEARLVRASVGPRLHEAWPSLFGTKMAARYSHNMLVIDERWTVDPVAPLLRSGHSGLDRRETSDLYGSITIAPIYRAAGTDPASETDATMPKSAPAEGADGEPRK